MPTAFITGATGQDGSYLIERLLREHWVVHALVRANPDVDETAVSGSVVSHHGDLADGAGLREIISQVRPDVIYNLGGITSVAASWKLPSLTALVTGCSVAAMLEECWALHADGHPVRFIQASSSEIFGDGEIQPQTESTPLSPLSPYGAAKAFAHHLISVYRSRGMFAASGIMYNHESPRRPRSFVTRKITYEVARIAAGLSDRLMLGTLDVARDWGWAPDYVDALYRIASAPVPDDFVVATNEAHTVRDFVSAAFHAAGIEDWQPYLALDPQFVRPVEAPTMRGDASKIKKELGWAPTKNFDEIVSAMVDHDRQLLRTNGP